MLLLDKKDQLWSTLWMSWKNTTLWNIPLSWLLLLLKLLLFNSWPLTPLALLANTSVTTESTPSLYTTIFLNKLSPTDKCPCCLEDPQEEKPILVMSFTSTPDCSKEPPKWTLTSVEDPWLLCPWLKPKPVTCPLISPPTWFPSLTAKSSWKPNFSTRVSALPLTWVCLCPVSAQLLKSKLWNKWLVDLNWNWLNIEKWLPSPNSVPTWTPPPNNCWTEVPNWLNYWNKSNSSLCLLKNKCLFYFRCALFMLAWEDSWIMFKLPKFPNSKKNSWLSLRRTTPRLWRISISTLFIKIWRIIQRKWQPLENYFGVIHPQFWPLTQMINI